MFEFETFVTDSAVVLALVAVDQHVVSETSFMYETFVAKQANKRTLFVVIYFVFC